MTEPVLTLPSRRVGVRETFGIDSDLQVPAFEQRDDHVPEIDPVYRFQPDATLALLYWRVGRRIHADVLAGDRAAYGAQSVVSVARQLGWIARVR